jgi:hypothetical protein
VNLYTDAGTALRARATLPAEAEHLLTCEDDCCLMSEADWQVLAALLRARVTAALTCLARPN